MSDFGSLLKDKRRNRGLTLESLSELLREKGIWLDSSVLSRWETGNRKPGRKDRDKLLGIATLLNLSDVETNELLTRAGLAPLNLIDLHLDEVLAMYNPRWRKTYFLCKELGWKEMQIGEKLGIPFWEVRNDIAKAEAEEKVQEIAANVRAGLAEHFADLSSVARRIIEMIVIPEPHYLLVSDLRYGKGPIVDVCALEWFRKPESNKMTVDFVDLSQDEFLEQQIFFQPLMSHMTDVKAQYQQLKDLLAEYIQKCHDLLFSIVSDGKQAIIEFAKDRAVYPKQLEEFAQSKLGKEPMFFDYGEKGGGLVVYRYFFTTAYHDTLVHAEHTEAIAQTEYQVDPEWGMLQYKYRDLAMGSDSDLKQLVGLHTGLIGKYGESALAENLFDSFHKIRDLQQAIKRELRTRILRRTFPGSCCLCPD